MSFNLFGPATKNDIRVGYISAERGFIDDISIPEANEYAKKNPGTTFIFKNRNIIRYLGINDVNNLTENDLISSVDSCTGIELESNPGPPKVLFYGGGGVGVLANPIIGLDGSVLAVDLVYGGNGYQYPPIVDVKDRSGIGAGAVARAVLGEVVETFEEEGDFENYELSLPEDVGYGRRYDPNGKDIGSWDPYLYANLIDAPLPPIPQRIGGKGIITDVIVDDPGNGYLVAQNDLPPEISSTYPVSLRLKNVIVENPGINYNCGVDRIEITPNNGAILDYECDTFGRIVNVKVLNPGLGFTRYPDIRMVSDNPTGVNASFRPQFEVVRDPIVVDTEKLIQVTDLVGLKQTGYVDGRAYYGSVFYKEGIRYAGFYETPGDLVQVYTTLQESIDARVITPPSAIQRQGTDVTSNDPRLNIPNTPENLI